MSEVYPVDSDLIPRIRQFLLSRKDGKGSFLRGSGRYGFGHAPPGNTLPFSQAKILTEITNAYICWALTEGGELGEHLSREIDSLMKTAEATKQTDPYFLRFESYRV